MGIVEDMCYEIRRAEACVDWSAHLVGCYCSQEGEREEKGDRNGELGEQGAARN